MDNPARVFAPITNTVPSEGSITTTTLKLRISGVILPLHNKSSCFDAALQSDNFNSTTAVNFRCLSIQTLEATNANIILITNAQISGWSKNRDFQMIFKYSIMNTSKTH
jgi:hypothetical protein